MEPEKLLPAADVREYIREAPASSMESSSLGLPSPKQQSWGAVISIIIIMLMVVIGAFYAWGERIAQNQIPPEFVQ